MEYPGRMPHRLDVMLSLLMLLFGSPLQGFAQQDLFAQHHRMMWDAILNNQVERVKALLKTPYVLINDPNYDVSYLAKACEFDAGSDHSEIVKVLIEAGANVKWRGPAGPVSGPVFYILATNPTQHPTLGILIEALEKVTGGVSTPEFKAVINWQSPFGNTALFDLVDRTGPDTQDNALFVARLLIETAQADPNIPGHLNMTPLSLAKAKHLDQMTEYLQDHAGTSSGEIAFRCDAVAPDECAFSVIDAKDGGTANFVLASGQTHNLSSNFSGGRYCVVASKPPAQVKDWPPNCINATEPSRGSKVVNNIRPGQTYD
jgi:hypothetical protein